MSAHFPTFKLWRVDRFRFWRGQFRSWVILSNFHLLFLGDVLLLRTHELRASQCSCNRVEASSALVWAPQAVGGLSKLGRRCHRLSQARVSAQCSEVSECWCYWCGSCACGAGGCPHWRGGRRCSSHSPPICQVGCRSCGSQGTKRAGSLYQNTRWWRTSPDALPPCSASSATILSFAVRPWSCQLF